MTQRGTYSFASLYQQRPVPAEGGLFKREWFKNIVHAAPEHLRWSRGYDLAVSNAATADYTASFRVAYDKEGNLYIDGGFRRRIEYPEQRRRISGRIEAERDTDHGIELSANGNAVLQDLRRERRARGHAFRGVKVSGTKVSRGVAVDRTRRRGQGLPRAVERGTRNSSTKPVRFRLGRTTTRSTPSRSPSACGEPKAGGCIFSDALSYVIFGFWFLVFELIFVAVRRCDCRYATSKQTHLSVSGKGSGRVSHSTARAFFPNWKSCRRGA